MISGAWAKLPRRWFRLIFGLLLSPFGYAKELVFCAVLIGLVIWPISWLQTWWLKETPAAAAAAARLRYPAITRILAAPNGDEILLFRDFREFVAIDSAGEERCQIPIFTPEFFQLGYDDTGWSCLFLDKLRVIRWHHVALGEVMCVSGSSPDGLRDLSLSADGRTAAALFSKREIRVWQRLEDGSATFRSWPLAHDVDKLYVSPRGRRIALRSLDNLLEWMDPGTGKISNHVYAKPTLPVCHAWSADEQWFAVGTDDRQIHVWRANTQSDPHYTLRDLGVLFSLTMSDDGRWLVAGLATGELSAWHDGQQVWSKVAHPAGIRGLDLLADRKSIVSGCVQGGLKIHALKDGKLLSELPNERN